MPTSSKTSLHVGEVAASKSHKFLGLELCWWGWGQWYKWRWNRTHIDLGPLTLYGIQRPWLWLPLAWAIKPARLLYHAYVVNRGGFQSDGPLGRLERQAQWHDATTDPPTEDPPGADSGKVRCSDNASHTSGGPRR